MSYIVKELLEALKPHDKFTGYSEWDQEISYTSHGNHKIHNDSKTGDEVAKLDGKVIGRWSHAKGDGYVYK